MLQDRLTARFLKSRTNAPEAVAPKADPVATPKTQTPSAMDTYARGRQLQASVWI